MKSGGSSMPFTIGKLMNTVDCRGFAMRDYFCLPYPGLKMPIITLTQNQMSRNSLLPMDLVSRKIIRSMMQINYSTHCNTLVSKVKRIRFSRLARRQV